MGKDKKETCHCKTEPLTTCGDCGEEYVMVDKEYFASLEQIYLIVRRLRKRGKI